MRSLGFVAVLVLVGVFSCSSQESGSKPGAPGKGGSSIGGSATAGSPAGGASAALGGATAGIAGSSSGAAGSSSAGIGGASGSGGGAGSAGSSGLPFGHPDPTVKHPAYDGFTLWLVEDFTQPLDLAKDPVWTWSDGGFQTHRFTRDAIGFDDGKMVLTLSDAAAPSSCSFSNTGQVPPRTRKAGELRSKHNWFRYGRYETRIKAPMVKPNDAVTNGNYIASLFTYRQPACQEWREIDLEVTGDAPGRLSTNLIVGDLDCNFTADKEQPATFDLPGSFRTEFQTIGFEWLPGSIKFYYLDTDGKQVLLRELTGPKVPTLSAKLMANLWVFAAPFEFGGPLGANNELPFKAEYDFIRFYKWDKDADYPCADMSAACLKAEDVDLTGNNACDGVAFTGDLASCKQCGSTVRMACTDTCQ